MNVRKFFKSLLGDTSKYFTLLALIYSLLMLIINVKEEHVLLAASTLCFLFLFALLAALARGILRIKAISSVARVLLHYVILLLAFYLCMLLPKGMRAPQILVGSVLFTAVYWIGAAIVHLFLARFRTKTEQNTDYESQFSKKR